MLYLTGFFKGKSVEDKLISPKELIEHFNLPINLENGAIRFALHRSQFGKNKADGTTTYQMNKMLQPILNGTYKSDSYVIRYAEKKVFNESKKRDIYFPRRILFSGKSMSVKFEDKLDLAVFLLLKPQCGESIFHRKGKATVYTVEDKMAEAKAKLEVEGIFNKIRDMILGESDDFKIMRIAKGLKLKGKSVIPGPKTRNGLEAKYALLELAKQYPSDVLTAYMSEITFISGVVKDAIDRNIVTINRVGQGVKIWRFHEDIQNGKEICRVSRGQDEKTTLIDHITNPEVYASFVKAVNAVVYGNEIDKNVEVLSDKNLVDLADDSNPINLISASALKDIIGIDRSSGKVWILEEDGSFPEKGTPIHVAENKKEWKAETAANIGKVNLNRIKKALEKK